MHCTRYKHNGSKPEHQFFFGCLYEDWSGICDSSCGKWGRSAHFIISTLECSQSRVGELQSVHCRVALSVTYGLNALFVLLTLIALATNLCNGEICNETYECAFGGMGTDDIEYCVEGCRPGRGAVLACVASFLWVLSCIGATRSFLSFRQEESAADVEYEPLRSGNLELDASAGTPFLC